MSVPQQKKILIIDDEPDVVAYLAAFLKDNGFEVITASDAPEGFKKATIEKPDLITLDITMPKETGIRLLGKLQDDPRTCSLPVIIITGTPGEFEQLCADDGHGKALVGYFEKPIQRDQLLKRIREILKIA